MATTSRKAFRYPIGTDSPNLAQYFQNLANDVDAVGQYRGSVTTFPTNAVYGDYVFHETYQCFMAYAGSATFWRQMTIPEATASLYSSALLNAGLSMHNGFQVFDPATDRLYTCTSSASNLLQYTGGGTAPVTQLGINSGWNAAATSYYTMAAYLDGSGVAHLQGSINNTNSFSGVSNAVTNPSLPTIFRPAKTVAIPLSSNTGAAASIQITAAGVITIYPFTTAAAGSIYSLDGVSWHTSSAL